MHLLELYTGSCQVSHIFRNRAGYTIDPWENSEKVLKKAQVAGLRA